MVSKKKKKKITSHQLSNPVNCLAAPFIFMDWTGKICKFESVTQPQTDLTNHSLCAANARGGCTTTHHEYQLWSENGSVKISRAGVLWTLMEKQGRLFNCSHNVADAHFFLSIIYLLQFTCVCNNQSSKFVLILASPNTLLSLINMNVTRFFSPSPFYSSC